MTWDQFRAAVVGLTFLKSKDLHMPASQLSTTSSAFQSQVAEDSRAAVLEMYFLIIAFLFH